LIAAGLGLILLIPTMWLFVSFTATPVHSSAESVPNVPGSVSPTWASAVDQARKMVLANVTEQNLPGLSVAVGVDGELAWAEGFGFADLRNSVAVTPEQQFRIGTASTVLTSAAAGLLLESGQLKLDDPIQTYLPKFPRKDVTLGQLMGHNPGAVPDDNNERPLFRTHCGSPAEVLEHYSHSWLTDVDGVRDSVYDYILVSAAIEAVTKQPFFNFMQEKVFDPVGMRSTMADREVIDYEGEDFPLFTLFRELIHDPEASRQTPEVSKKATGDRATTFYPRFGKDPKHGMHGTRMADYSCYAGSSGILSTPTDLVHFGMAIQKGKLLRPETVELLQGSPSELSYSLGWEIKTVSLAGKPARMAGHDGMSLGGKVASLMTFPEYGIAVAVTSNISYADTASLGVRIAEAFVAQRRNAAGK
jgi:CubicO group peptidase (beta-lactamase class C family)